jgi:hypothetical protein
VARLLSLSITRRNGRRQLFADHLLTDWKAAGLLFPSVATAIVRTVKGTMIDRKLGSLTGADFQSVERQLRRALGFSKVTA